MLTKSPLLLRDVDLFTELSERARFTAYLSIPTLDERAWRETEPRAPSPRARLKALKKLADHGIAVGVVIAPLLPGINDNPTQLESIVAAATEAGAESIDALPLHLRGSTKDVFMNWLQDAHPELVSRYQDLYRGGSEMKRSEQERLLNLAYPRGRTWDDRVRELQERLTARRAVRSDVQQSLF